MNDHYAIEAINAVLDECYRTTLTAHDAILKIARISGANQIEHQEAKEQK